MESQEPKETFFYSNDQINSSEQAILDTRFQSFLRLYIFDLNNADPCDELNYHQHDNLTKKSVIRINDLYFSKVCICGNIVNIFESEKYYRLKIDDSTGCINATLWKDSIFDEHSLNLSFSSNCQNIQDQFSELYSQINSIHSRIKESSINNLIQYEPKQGDMVMIRGHVRTYKQRIELNAVSCVRVKNSAEELVQMILPSILSEKIYTKKSISFADFENLSKKNEFIETNQHKTNTENVFKNENFLDFVLKKLCQMSKSDILDQSRKIENTGSDSCESFRLYRFLKSNCPNEFKSVDHKQVLEALKELESKGLVYSCEDEYH